jgi:plasmid stability protein
MTNVQVRNVPEDVLAALKKRAASYGESLQSFLLGVLTEEAGVETNAEILAEAAAEPGGYEAKPGEAAELIRQGRAERDEVLFGRWR